MKITAHDPRGRSGAGAAVAALAAALAATATATADAHHSFAMFDHEHPIEIEGTVTEFRYTSPHSFILIAVKGTDDSTATWNLEGPAPSILARDGMSAKTIKPGDEVILKIEPLRSGAPGGSWSLINTRFKDGHPLVTP